MLWVNFSRNETAGLEAVDNLYFLATDVQPGPAQLAPWEGGPPITWVFIYLVDSQLPGQRILVSFTSQSRLVLFTKKSQASVARQLLPPSNEAIRVSVDWLREKAPLYDIIVDPQPEEFVPLLTGGRFTWADDGLESLVDG